MSILLGAIGDDITGSTDLALMLAANGMSTVQFMGVPGPGTKAGNIGPVAEALLNHLREDLTVVSVRLFRLMPVPFFRSTYLSANVCSRNPACAIIP